MGRQAGQLNTVARRLFGPLFKVLWRFDVEGLGNVPAHGPAILAPNHTSVIDSFFLPCVLPRRITYIGKAEYLDSWKTRTLFPAIGMIPVDRSSGRRSLVALDAAAELLERGELFGIYPEGTRSRSGKLHKGHTGPARLALRTGAPIVPVGLVGTREIQPPEARFPRPFLPVAIRFGRPISVDRYLDRADDRLVLRQIIDEVMYGIRELSGQEYVNTYAGAAPSAVTSGSAARLATDGRPTHHHAPAGLPETDAVLAVIEEAVGPRRSSAEVLGAAAARHRAPA